MYVCCRVIYLGAALQYQVNTNQACGKKVLGADLAPLDVVWSCHISYVILVMTY